MRKMYPFFGHQELNSRLCRGQSISHIGFAIKFVFTFCLCTHKYRKANFTKLSGRKLKQSTKSYSTYILIHMPVFRPKVVERRSFEIIFCSGVTFQFQELIPQRMSSLRRKKFLVIFQIGNSKSSKSYR